MPTERLTPARRRQLTREALVAAAHDVFAAKGFHGASLDEIAEAAGFTRGAIYSNFGGKEELFYAVIERADDLLLVAMAEAMDATTTGDLVGDAVAAADSWTRGLQPSAELLALSLEVRLFALRNPASRERIAELERRATDRYVAFIETELARWGRTPRMPARDLAFLGRAVLDGLNQVSAIDVEHADYYNQLVQAAFVLLAQAAVELDPAGATAHPGVG